MSVRCVPCDVILVTIVLTVCNNYVFADKKFICEKMVHYHDCAKFGGLFRYNFNACACIFLAILFCSPDTCKLPSLSRLADNVILALEDDLPEQIQNGTEVTFACTDGYALTKGGVLTCREDGIWQGILPECARKLIKSSNNVNIIIM